MFIVLELQTNPDGTVGTIAAGFDERAAAESRYHEILAAAALSELPIHAAVLLTGEGVVLARQSYSHP